MATQSPSLVEWFDGMRAQFRGPSLVDAMVAAGLFADETKFTARRVNPYGAHRYPRLGLMKKSPLRTEWDEQGRIHWDTPYSDDDY